MIINHNNKIKSSIYKSNSNLVSFLAQKDEIKQLARVERGNKVVSYGKKSYISKLINKFKSDNHSGTQGYWLEVSE